MLDRLGASSRWGTVALYAVLAAGLAYLVQLHMRQRQYVRWTGELGGKRANDAARRLRAAGRGAYPYLALAMRHGERVTGRRQAGQALLGAVLRELQERFGAEAERVDDEDVIERYVREADSIAEAAGAGGVSRNHLARLVAYMDSGLADVSQWQRDMRVAVRSSVVDGMLSDEDPDVRRIAAALAAIVGTLAPQA